MMESLKGYYTLKGSYRLNGIEGSQMGNLYCSNKGIVVGVIRDNNNSPGLTIQKKKEGYLIGLPGGDSPNKFLLGMINEKLQFLFCKMSQSSLSLNDAMWAVEGNANQGELTFKGGWTFIGKRGTENASLIINGLETLLANPIETIDPLKLLGNVSVEELQERLFKKEYLNSILTKAVRQGQTGEIILERGSINV